MVLQSIKGIVATTAGLPTIVSMRLVNKATQRAVNSSKNFGKTFVKREIKQISYNPSLTDLEQSILRGLGLVHGFAVEFLVGGRKLHGRTKLATLRRAA